MTITQMKQIKKERGLTNAMIAEMADIPLSTVQKVFTGETRNPRFETLDALEKVFLTLDVRILDESTNLPWYGGEEEKKPLVYSFSPTRAQMVAEPGWSYGTSALQNPGPFTVDDYFNLPEGERAELIDGQLIRMDAPSVRHQLIAGEIHRQIANFIYDNEGSCMPGIAPLSVQLDCDDKTMVQPDVLVVCDPKKVRDRVVYGAPDFTLEVLSPSTALKDIMTKREKYRCAGVREYWLIDPASAILDVYAFGFDEAMRTYDMTAPVGVRIFGGKLQIDFKRILQWIKPAESEGGEK